MSADGTISTNRIEAFSDGVFAIVITLLVLELRVPHVEHGRDFNELAKAVWMLAPKFLSFLLSFLFAAIFWVTHHQLFHQLRHSTRSLLWLNNLFLLFLTFLPFPTAMLGEYPENKFAVMFFGLEMIFSIGAFLLLRWYASFKAKLLQSAASEAESRKALTAGIAAVGLYVLAVIICFFNTTAAIGVYVLTPFLYLLTQRKTRN
jgi:uncharacterized membrane protein